MAATSSSVVDSLNISDSEQSLLIQTEWKFCRWLCNDTFVTDDDYEDHKVMLLTDFICILGMHCIIQQKTQHFSYF